MSSTRLGLLAAAGFLALTSVASCADMEARPAYKAPLAPALLTPWGGFYVGGQVGASVASMELVSVDCCSPLLDPSAHTHPRVTQGLVGGYVGFNLLMGGPLVIGIEADLNAKFGSSEAGDFSDFPSVGNGWRSRSTFEGTVRGRLGFLVTSRALIYATSGWAFSKFELDNPGCSGCAQWGSTNLYGLNRNGLVIGGGGEYAVDPNWHVKIEYIHAHYGTKSLSVDNGQNVLGYSSTIQTDSVRAGVSYRWGRPGSGTY